MSTSRIRWAVVLGVSCALGLICATIDVGCRKKTREPTEVDFCGKSFDIDAKEVFCFDEGKVDAGPLRRLHHVESLVVYTRLELSKITHLAGSLRYLSFRQVRAADIRLLPMFSELRALTLRNGSLKQICPTIAALPKLEALHIDRTQVEDISCLRRLKKLHTLSVTFTKVHDISVVRQLPNLAVLWFECSPVQDIGPLLALRKLSVLGAMSDDAKHSAWLNEVQRRNPTAWIWPHLKDNCAWEAHYGVRQ